MHDSRGVQVVSNCYNRGEVSMTFDDASSFRGQELEMARIMEGSGGLGSFFVNGLNREGTGVCIYDRAQDLKSLYERVGVWVALLTEIVIDAAELEKLETAMIKILGVRPKYFRPPYGSYTDLVLKVLSERGYTKMFLWTDATRDWNSDLKYQKEVIDEVVDAYPGPRILLQHPPFEFTNQAVKYAAPRLAARGYKIVNIDDCTGGTGAYAYVGAPQARDSTWVC
ncbi:hypothetical protein JCM24511_10222 [Saitozyma sp. JCM 24511]|nr:hypothetical protein JCM24511_10222 [Saitozyma sp. JCM 24511]